MWPRIRYELQRLLVRLTRSGFKQMHRWWEINHNMFIITDVSHVQQTNEPLATRSNEMRNDADSGNSEVWRAMHDVWHTVHDPCTCYQWRQTRRKYYLLFWEFAYSVLMSKFVMYAHWNVVSAIQSRNPKREILFKLHACWLVRCVLRNIETK